MFFVWKQVYIGDSFCVCFLFVLSFVSLKPAHFGKEMEGQLPG